MTGYQVYWSGGGELDGSENMTAWAGNNSLNITSHTLNSITIVALSYHLPSSAVSGAVFNYQGESNYNNPKCSITSCSDRVMCLYWYNTTGITNYVTAENDVILHLGLL